MKELIRNAMNDLLQKNIYCNYIVKTKKEEHFLQNTLAMDAYLFTYKMSLTYGDVVCYIAPLGTPAAMPVFEVLKGKIYLSGCEIKTERKK